MARQKRLNLPGAIYHLITRGLNGSLIFKDNADREEFLRRLAESLDKSGCQCFAWALMSNHIHLLLRSSEKPLSEFARKLFTGYAIYFNHRHKRRGYLYQNRYKSILCQEDSYLLELVRYIHLNPVRAGIIKNLNKLDSYLWCGHSALVGHKRRVWQSVDEILAFFNQKKRPAIAAYRQYVEDGWLMGKRHELVGGGLKRSAGGWGGVRALGAYKNFWRGDEQILGDGEFVEKVLKLAAEAILKREQFKRQGWTTERLAQRVCAVMSVSADVLKKKGRKNQITQAKALFAFWGYQIIGLNGMDLAHYLNIARPSLSGLLKQGETLAKEKNLNLIN